MFSKLDLVLSSSVLHSYVALNTNHTPSTLGVLTVLKISSDGFLNTPNHDRSRVHLASPPRLKYLCVCVFKRECVVLKFGQRYVTTTYAHSFSRDESPIQTLIPTLNFKACVSRVRIPVFVCLCVCVCVCRKERVKEKDTKKRTPSL